MRTVDVAPETRRDRHQRGSILPWRQPGQGARNVMAASLFLAPFLILLLLFQYVPLALMTRNSLYSYSLLNPAASSFVGMQNYLDIISDPDARGSFLTTLLFAAGVVATVVPAGLSLALILDTELPARALIRTIILVPVVSSAVVVATIWTFLLDPANGLINGLLAWIRLGPYGFLTDRSLALPALVVMTLWQQVGFAAILFLAGLQAIPVELGEAALVDGATKPQRFWHVTLPLLARTTLFVVVIMTVFSLQAFAPALIMTSGGPQASTNFIVYEIYQLAFALHDAGYASALSVVLLLAVLLVSIVQMGILRVRWNY
ncbi:MAG: sugar ABC transporter permease [Proteobacteria bacterium]|nr:sugar ABC transporter permease [Pseudomonadota bacterium]MBI3496906.1 sugar ABC transporter permease [Pseudomonadota bacterium]